MNDIYVAKLGKTVGLKGYLRLFIESDFPEQFKKDATFFTDENIELKVLQYNKSKNLIQFYDYEDIELAKKLTNIELFVSKESSKKNCQLKENEHFWFDLKNCKVYEKELFLGIVDDIYRYPLNDYLQIKTSKEFTDKDLPKIFLLPYIFDTYIINVDINSKKIEVKNAYEILENS